MLMDLIQILKETQVVKVIYIKDLTYQIMNFQNLMKLLLFKLKCIVMQLNVPNVGGIQDVDIELLVEDLLDELYWHLAEG